MRRVRKRDGGGLMSLTFGERLAAVEESQEALAELMDILLKAAGLIDMDGKWVEVDETTTGEAAG